MASRLQDVLLRGTAAAKPLATDVAIGTLYYSTDLGATEQSDGTTWNTYTDGGSAASSIASDRLLGRDTAGVGLVEQLTVTSGIEFTGAGGVRLTTAARTQTVGITVDGGGTVLTIGVKGYRSFPVAGTITAWRLFADVSGDIEFDVLLDPFASFPPTTSIVATAPPLFNGAQSDEDTVGTWATDVDAGDVFGFEITGIPDLITRVTLELTIVLD